MNIHRLILNISTNFNQYFFLFESTVLVIIFCNFQNVLIQIWLATSKTMVISLPLSYDYGITDYILIHELQTPWKLESPRKLENSLEIGYGHNLDPIFHSWNETLAMTFKINFFCSCTLLLDFFTLFRIFCPVLSM